MIRAIKRTGPELKVGEILPFPGKDYLNTIHSDDFDHTKYLVPIIDIFGQGPFITLSKLNIDTYHIEDTYECPHTGMEFYSFIPMYLITNDLNQFIKPTRFNEPLFDKEWQWAKHFKMSLNEFISCEIYEQMLGTGYTSETARNDGMNTKRLFAMDLDGDSTIIGLTHVWFNK